MGKYIEKTSHTKGLPAKGKVELLVAAGAVITTNEYQPNLICVVDNGPFEAAAYVYSEKEYMAFNYARDTRPKTWLTWDKVAEMVS